MKKFALILTTLLALPATLSCQQEEKPRTLLQRVAAHYKAICCGVCALIVGYFLFRSPAQQPAQKPVQATPPGGPQLSGLEQQPVVEEEASQDDPFARQRARHQRHLAQQAAAEKAKRDAARAEQEKQDAAIAKQLAEEPAARPASSFDREVDRPPLPQSGAVSLFDDVD